jgi:hypothetical protein
MRFNARCATAAGILAAVVASLQCPLAVAEVIHVAGSPGQPGLALASQAVAGVELRYAMDSFSLDPLAIGDQEYQKLTLPGVFLPNNAGAPDLPGLSHYVAMPQGARARVEIVSAQTQVYQNVRISPAPVIPREDDDSPLVYEQDAAIYGRDAYYPASPVLVSEPMVLRGVDAAIVGVTPFQYNPVTRELVVYTQLEVRVDFVGGNGRFGEDRLRNRYWEPILQEHLLNYESLPAVDFDARPSRDRYGWEYVIITPTDAGFMAWADSLKAWRKLQGVSTEVFTTAQTGTTAAQIESWLNNAYTTWDVPPVAFMILGDYPSSGEGGRDIAITSPIWTSYCVSDNMYADVNGDDLPDMAHGRICARNEPELAHMLDKMFTYERHPYTDPNYYDHPVIAGGWQTERWFILCTEVIYGHQANVLGKHPTREYAIYSGTPGTVWSSNQNTNIVVNYFGPSGLGYIPLTPQHLTDWGGNATRINADLNAGAYMLMHRDHGAETGWGEPAYSNSSLDGLHNTMYPFVFSINCLTGKYNYSSECFSEKFHRMTYGAVGLTAASEVSYSFVNDAFVWGMFDSMWHGFMPDYGPQPVDSDFRYPSFAMCSGKHFLQASSWPYNPGDKTVTYHLFHHHGDVFLPLYANVPQNLNVVHDGVCFVGVDFFTIQATAGSLISLTVDGEIVGVATATGMSQDIPIIPQADPGNLRITVTKPDYYRHDEIVPIIPPAGPYVSVGQKLVNDDMTGGSAGNGDGTFDAGETIEFLVFLKNVGTQTATNVRATLASPDEYVTITDNYETYGNILPGGENPPMDDFDLVIAPDCPDGHMIDFTLMVESDNRMSWEKSFSMPVEAPEIGLSQWTINDVAGGNGNGRIEPGETITLSATLNNTGSEDATNLDAALTISSGYVTITQGSATLAMLPAGGSGLLAPAFAFTVAPNCPDPDLLLAHLMVSADWGQGGQLDFGLPVGGFWDDMEDGQGDWTSYIVTTGFVNEWHYSTQRSYSPTHSWKCGSATGGSYANLADGALQSADCTLRTTSWLKFRHWMDAEVSSAHAGYCYDGGLVEASVNGGPWQQIFPVGGYTHRIRTGSTPGPLPAETEVYSGTINWAEAVFELNDLEGQVRFRFRFTSDGATVREGWYVDNVELFGYGLDPSDVEVQQVRLEPAIDQNRPNPFGTGTGIVFRLPTSAPVSLRVFDTAGRLVRTLVDGQSEAGTHVISWDGRDEAGRALSSGVYYYRFETSGASETRKMILSR